MGVVVLNPLELDTVKVHGVLRRQVLRVQIVGHETRTNIEQAAEVLDAVGERAQGLEVLEVADVMGDEHPAVLADTEGVLQLGPAGEHRAGERHGSVSGSGTWPLDRRSSMSRPPKERVTESSVRVWIGRSWTRK